MLEIFLLIELSVNWTKFKEIRMLIDVGIDFGPRKTDCWILNITFCHCQVLSLDP